MGCLAQLPRVITEVFVERLVYGQLPNQSLACYFPACSSVTTTIRSLR